MISYEISTYSPNGEEEVTIVRSDGVWIPADPANTDYQQYLAWLEEGNVPEEWNHELEDN